MRAKTPYKKCRKRLGCGIGSGHGKTSTKGHKGQRARAGYHFRPGFEGGQNPLYRRLPKRGFNHNAFKKFYSIVNLEQFAKLGEKEVTPELSARMADYFTVYGKGKVNINTAGNEILHCIIMDDKLTGKIIEFRKGEDGKPGTDDDGIFRNAGQIADLLSKEKGLTAEKRQQILDCLDVRSECFRARSLGRLTGRQGLTAIDFVVDCRQRFWYWREH